MYERRDRVLYDTHKVWPGREERFFGNANVGDRTKTNMQLGNCLASDKTFTIMAIGVRLLGKTRDQEDLLLDYLRSELVIGDKPYCDDLGPRYSMLRRADTQESLKRLEKETQTEIDLASDWVESRAKTLEDLPVFLLGYQLAAPLVIPIRQSFNFTVSPGKETPEVLDVRVHLFGLETRQVA